MGIFPNLVRCLRLEVSTRVDMAIFSQMLEINIFMLISNIF
nr:MAG TPA: hypothetical protein [Caudoviricetes sp.]